MNYTNWQTNKDDLHQQQQQLHHQQQQQQQQQQQHVQNLSFRNQPQQSLNDKSSMLDTTSPIDTSNTDPALTSTASSGSIQKPISQTKRAEQNRNAQRAFRQRRDKYMQDLELKVQELDEMKAKYQNLNNENVQLKDYVMILQRKIIELTQGKEMDHQHDNLSNPFGPK
ncbi:kapC [Candida jiufengensis]|uniref:kapC n=1 Tax=Candida jiufengensis TaxID=497108 RepID=UPI0022258421|nr:kapC [Candida jiufengensis]KAI5951505.1 kapC [Candida jiufengensis]